MFENPRRGGQARNFTTNAPKILDLRSSSEQIFSRKLPLGAPVGSSLHIFQHGSSLSLENVCDSWCMHQTAPGFSSAADVSQSKFTELYSSVAVVSQSKSTEMRYQTNEHFYSMLFIRKKL